MNTTMRVIAVILLLLIEGVLLSTTASATICVAECEGGGSVYCSGPNCGAIDYYGCDSWDDYGNRIDLKWCPEWYCRPE